VTTSGTTETVTSTPVGIAVNGATVTLGTVTLGSSSISAYGTSSVSVPVLISGSPATVPISVAFTSPCVSAGKATLNSPVTNSSSTGIATSTYKDNGCNSGTDTITASVTGATATASATITVIPPTANNMQFVSATPAIIGTSPTGAATLPKSSLVKFQVVDINGNGVPGVTVDFSLKPSDSSLGITLSATQAISDSNGDVTTSVTSGAVPTPVWVVAKVHSNPAILSQSNTLTITTGLPAQNFFSLSVQTHNIEGWSYDGVSSTVTIIASDRLGEPVPDGTVINFISEGGHFSSGSSTATCTTTSGTCTIKFISAAYRPSGETIDYGGSIGIQGAVAAGYYDDTDTWQPITFTYSNGTNSNPLYVQNGRVTILAYTIGEMSFVDAHGTNVYQSDDTFYDLGQLFLDSNENGILDTNPSQPNLQEQTIGNAPGTSACGTHIGGSPTAIPYCTITNGICTDYTPSDYATAPSAQNTCSGAWGQTYVRREDVIILSGSSAQISQNSFQGALSCFAEYSFWLMDENYNPMPAGTTVSINSNYSSSVNYLYTVSSVPTSSSATVSVASGTPVLDTTHGGGTIVSLLVNGGSSCQTAASAGTILAYPTGVTAIDVTTPTYGIKTTIPININ